jgi:DNA mismatch endonuclease (patch repair protein)
MRLIIWISLHRVMDNLTKEQRRKNMQNIRSTGTRPERVIMTELKKRKIYFASYVSKIIGKPDIVFRRKKVVIFIDSDFWHGHPQRCIMPTTNPDYWVKKLSDNCKRDEIVNNVLMKNGWKVVRLWEYDIKHNLDECLRIILTSIEKTTNIP